MNERETTVTVRLRWEDDHFRTAGGYSFGYVTILYGGWCAVAGHQMFGCRTRAQARATIEERAIKALGGEIVEAR
jgi:hypothetical protein